MVLQARAPVTALARHVELLWYHEGQAAPHAYERCLPTGNVELIINLAGDEVRLYDRRDPGRFDSFRGAVVCGAHSTYFVIDTASQGAILGVHFRLGGAFPFLGLPADELRDLHVGLDELWGSAAAELRDRLRAAPSAEARFRLVESALIARAQRWDRHPAVGYSLRRLEAPDPVPVAGLADEVGISRRRLTELFRREVGLTPKAFARVRRFQGLLGQVFGRARVDWADLAVGCGYYDQAHLVHDFGRMTGLTPGRYLQVQGEHFNHVPM